MDTVSEMRTKIFFHYLQNKTQVKKKDSETNRQSATF